VNRWPHQNRTTNAILGRLDDGQDALSFTIPTGGGKTLVFADCITRLLPAPVAFYTDRLFLRKQLSSYFLDQCMYHGVRAAGEEKEHDHPFQLCSIQTALARSIRGNEPLHPAKYVFVDEGHKQAGEETQKIWRRHRDEGAKVVFGTATPLGMACIANELIVGAITSELRKCGALVLSHHFAPDEPDWKAFKGLAPGMSFSDRQAAKAMAASRVYGSVWKNLQRLNPEMKPFMLFGPDVPGSLYYAERLTAEGVPTAHIDGKWIYLDGKLHKNDDDGELFEEVRRRSKEGGIKGVCSRFVLREGIDFPWIAHLIFACTFSSLQSYLQAGGRGLRAYPGLPFVTVQDHGGNWWRHGSLNEDRKWRLGLTDESAQAHRADRFRYKEDKEPFVCPQCQRVWTAKGECECGYKLAERTLVSRPVLCVDGTLAEMKGPIFRPRSVTKNKSDRQWNKAIFDWCRVYIRSHYTSAQRNFREAEALYAREHHFQWPCRDWPCMPINFNFDGSALVHRTPQERLTSVPQWVNEELVKVQERNERKAQRERDPEANSIREASTQS
jgi:superfamily II DNA or RNA helicase